jgi:rhomboid protease GluP
MTTDARPAPYVRVFLAIVAINIALYVLQILKGVDWMAPQTTHMIEWGANVAPLTMTGEPWRLFSSMFLHIGFIHLALNMYMLLLCGPIVERAFGSVKFALIYLISGVFGSLASASWYAQHKVETVSLFGVHAQGALQVVMSAGASGALMGIAGAFLARSLVLDEVEMDQNHTPVMHGGMRGAFVQTIGINLFMGFASSGVDNACHIGGLLAGAAIGGGLALAGGRRQRFKRIGATFAIVAGSLALLFFAMTTRPSTELLELKTRISAELQKLARAKVAAQAKVDRAQEISRDLKTAVAPVDEKTAAGTLLPLGNFSREMVLSKDGKRMYLVGGEGNFLDVVDFGAKKIVATVRGAALKPLAGGCGVSDCMAGRGANAIALSPDEHFAYVSSMVDNAVTVIDLQQNKIVTSIPVGDAPRSIKVSGNGQRAYVLNTRDNSVSVLDLAANKAVGSALVLQGGALQHSFLAPSELWLANDDKEVWVVNSAMSLLSVVDAGTMEIKKELNPGDGNVFRAGVFFTKSSSAWIAGFQTLDSISLKTRTVEKFISFCQEISRTNMDINPENTMIALESEDGKYIRLVKIKTQATVGVYPVTGGIGGVRFSADGKQLYVLNNNPAGQALAIIDINKTADVAKYVEQSGELFCARQ